MPIIVVGLFLVLACVSEAQAAINPRTDPNCVRKTHVCVDKTPRFIAGQKVLRPCWRWRDRYQCPGAMVDTCKPLIAKGCQQVSSACISRQPDGSCATFQNTYQCIIKKGTTVTRQVCGNAAMCVAGTCFKTNTPPANDFAYVVSRFAAAAAAGASASASGGISIFKGGPEHCNRTILGAKNCCTASPSGWGKNIIKGCPASAKKLAQARQAATGHFIGSFCAAKGLFGICLRIQEVWCVFPSKLARIIQEQGRPQLGIGWGAAQAPNCRGFTPQEFQRLDFSKMNLSEFYSDIMNRMTPMNGTKLGNRIQTRMRNYYNSGAPNGGRIAP
ncbi:conjugal transfer protein TraN [Mariprofundus ferrooxydans]|nr:conjugal transfer protein TraN [Mariprofundus ferrooxydans]